MNPEFKKPLPRSKTPDPQRNRRGDAAICRTDSRPNNRGETRLTANSCRLPSRIAKSENDLSVQRKQSAKSKETLSKEDMLALSYNAYLQSCLMAVHDAEIREQKEKEMFTIMENQQKDLITLEEENHYLDLVLLKVKLFKRMKEEIEKKIGICKRINESVNEQALEAQIKTMEDNISKTLLKNFKLPSTNEEKKEVLDLFEKISKELDKIPEIKKLVQPLNDVSTTLLKTKELNDEADELKKTVKRKLKHAEDLMYDVFYLKTKTSESEMAKGDSSG